MHSGTQQTNRKSNIALISATAAAVGFLGAAQTPQARHFGNLFTDSITCSFSCRPPIFSSIADFSKSLKASSTKKGFGEITQMSAVCYHSASNVPLNTATFSSPERFCIEGNLLATGKLENGKFYFDFGDEKKALLRIVASENILPEWNPITPGGHKALLTFKQGDSDKTLDSAQIVDVNAAGGMLKMQLENARFEY